MDRRGQQPLVQAFMQTALKTYIKTYIKTVIEDHLRTVIMKSKEISLKRIAHSTK
jgi:hypothetical protein